MLYKNEEGKRAVRSDSITTLVKPHMPTYTTQKAGKLPERASINLKGQKKIREWRWDTHKVRLEHAELPLTSYIMGSVTLKRQLTRLLSKIMLNT